MTGEKRILGADSSDETPSQTAARVNKPPQTVNVRTDSKVVIKGEDSIEIITQCPPISSSRLRSTVQRANTLPPQQPQNFSENVVQRSKTAPNLDPRSISSTPKKKSVREQEPPVSNVNRPRAIPVSTDGYTSDEEAIPSSPATDVSCTLSPTFGHHLPFSPSREITSSYSFPVQPGDQGDGNQTRHRCHRSGGHDDRYDHQTPTARSVQGSKSPAHTISASSSKKVITTSRTPVRSTGRGTSRQHQPAKKIVWGSSSTNRPPSPCGSSQLTYVSDDQRPAVTPTHSTGDSDYYTPSLRNSEMSDADSEPPKIVPSSTSKRKGKRRASPPSSSLSNQGSPVKESSSASSSLSIDSPHNPNSVSGLSHKKRRSRYPHPPSQERTQPQGHGQSLGQDICHCMGPCPSCHKPRFPPPPQVHPFMFQPNYHPYLYFPPPHMSNGYPLTHYGPSPYPYPYAIPHQTDLIPSISSAQPPPLPSGYHMSPALATHPPTANPNPPIPIHVSPAFMPSTPIPTPSTSSATSSPVSVDSPPVVHPATKQVSPELLEALDQFYQPPQRSVTIIDPSCDPRSPYSKEASVPALLNR